MEVFLLLKTSGAARYQRKFFSDPVICLDGDLSGQNASLRIAEKLLPFINENNKIYFSIMPEGSDPDDFIKINGKEKFINLLKEKSIIQSFIWNHFLNKIDKNNPFEISKFEKEIKRVCYSIKDETLKKYVLEDFLDKIKKLTPIQNSKRIYTNFKNYNKKNYYVLNETKKLYKKKDHLSKIQLKEFSIIFIMFHYLKIALQKAFAPEIVVVKHTLLLFASFLIEKESLIDLAPSVVFIIKCTSEFLIISTT